MTNRAGKSGFAADVQKKLDETYDVKVERDVLQWISAVLGQPDLFKGVTGRHAVCEKLKDGIIICQLMNKVQPGLIGKIHGVGGKKLLAAHEIENISKFLTACSKLGMNETNLFVTLDLHDGNNVNQVNNTIRNLAVFVEDKKGFTGPRIKRTEVPILEY